MVFYNPENDVSCVCHGDDFTLVGEEGDLRELAEKMATWFEIKVRALMGPDPEDDKEVVILGRTVRWKDWGIEFEADQKHRKILAEFFELEADSAAAAHNGDREHKEYEEEEDIIMSKLEAKEFRGMVARLNYLLQDSPDIQYPAKELSKEMANPKISGWRRLKKTVRYLLGREAVVWRYA